MDIGYPLVLICGGLVGWGLTSFYWQRKFDRRSLEADQLREAGHRAVVTLIRMLAHFDQVPYRDSAGARFAAGNLLYDRARDNLDFAAHVPAPGYPLIEQLPFTERRKGCP